MPNIEWIATNAIKPNARNARTHSRKQIRQIADSIKTFGFVVPIVVDEAVTTLAGHGRLEASKLLGLEKVPVVRVEGLSEAKKRAFALAENKITQAAGWDRKMLAIELPELSELLIQEDLDVSITGFAPVEIEQITIDFEENVSDPADDLDRKWLKQDPVSQSGDVWRLGDHILQCGDARDEAALKQLVGDDLASMAFIDPPYNVRMRDVVGRGRIKHPEFAMASGELQHAEFAKFLASSFAALKVVSREGALHYVCTDWRHVAQLVEAGGEIYDEMLNIAVWVKSNAGLGSFYRSQHEFVGVFRAGKAAHLNNVELGRHGRSRSNVWHYAGVNSFRAGRMDDLRVHPTVKPVALVCDAIKDCTRRGDRVIDTFAGSGTTLLAAERVGRRAVCVEIEPRYVDVAIRRWQEFTRRDAIHVRSNKSFEEVAAHVASPV